MCPAKVARWRRLNLAAIENLFSTRSSGVTWEVRLTNKRWSRGQGELSSTGLLAIEKYLRRALESQTTRHRCSRCDGRLVWMAAVGAEVRFLVARPSKSELFDVFSFVAVPRIEKVRDAGKAAKALLVAGRRERHEGDGMCGALEQKSRQNGRQSGSVKS